MPTIYDCRWDDCLWLSLFWKYWLTCSELPNDEPGLVTHILKHFSWTPYNAMSRKFGMWMMMIWTKNLKQILDTFLALAKFSLQIWTTNPGANLRNGRSDARAPFVQKKRNFWKKLVTFGLQLVHSLCRILLELSISKMSHYLWVAPLHNLIT